ncbi:MAG: TlpA family protein disulfide reductase [Pedobacter sp.]|nr:MAG: TlpA family protein disulfide reductase [Pedobacter sp.]
MKGYCKFKSIILILALIFCYSISFAQVELLSFKQLESRLKKGKDTTFVINMWATWCAPCVEELPHFEKINDIYNNKKVKVILWSLDFKSKIETEVIPFVERKKLLSEVFVVNEKSQQDFIDKISKDWSGAIPATLIYQNSTKRREFYEKEFNYNELEQVIKSFIQH